MNAGAVCTKGPRDDTIPAMSDKTRLGGSDEGGFIDHVPLVGSVDRRQERANGLTHAVAAVGAIFAAAELLRLGARSGSTLVVFCLVIFSFTLIALYSISALYHLLPRSRAKRLFRLLDHVAILYLIAGSYTVVLLLFLHGELRWVMLVLEWGFALLGTLFKVFFLGRFRWLSMGLYLAMGWLALIALPRFETLDVAQLNLWLLLGGLSYMAGLIFFGSRRIRYHHAIWHLFVILGTVFDFIGLYGAVRILYR